jgi:F420-dependent oxidoreductase-like protein
MDLCLMIEGQEDVTWPQWLALAQACERHGVPALFRSDHYLNLSGHPDRGSADAWGTICALGAVTTKLRLGTMVSPTTFRHPSVLAKLVATADQISGGRIELGIGAGWNDREHEAYGFEFPSLRVRMAALEEQLEVITGSWTQAPFSFRGEHYQLESLEALPRPLQTPHPPIIMGGRAAPKGAALAARFASEYNTPLPTLQEAQERRARIAEACELEGRAPIPFSVMTPVVTASSGAGLDRRIDRIAAKLGEDAAAIRKSPPAGWVLGLLDEVAEQLGELERVGVARVMCQQVVQDDLDAVELLGVALPPLLAGR